MSDSSTRRPAVRQRLLVALQVMLMVASLLAVAPVAGGRARPIRRSERDTVDRAVGIA